MLKRSLVLGALLSALAFAPAPGAAAVAEAAAQSSCPAFTFKQNGVPWRARSIRRTSNVTCAKARALIRSYARPRNCQFRTACYIGGYTCRTTDAEGSEFTETCKRPGRSVRWRGSYSSR